MGTGFSGFFASKKATKPRPHLALLCKHKKMLHNETWRRILKEKAVIL